MFDYIVILPGVIFALFAVIFIGNAVGKRREDKSNSESTPEDYDLKEIDIARIDRMEDGSEFDREGIRNVVQAKRYTDPVGISAVQEVFSCMRYYKAKKAIVIASAKFTEPCETLAGINHVKLIDRDKI